MTQGYAVLPEAQSTETAGMTRYYLEINGESFEVPSKAVWDSVPGAITVAGDRLQVQLGSQPIILQRAG